MEKDSSLDYLTLDEVFEISVTLPNEITIAQAAILLGRCDRTIRNYVEHHGLKPNDVGSRRVRFSKEKLILWAIKNKKILVGSSKMDPNIL